MRPELCRYPTSELGLKEVYYERMVFLVEDVSGYRGWYLLSSELGQRLLSLTLAEALRLVYLDDLDSGYAATHVVATFHTQWDNLQNALSEYEPFLPTEVRYQGSVNLLDMRADLDELVRIHGYSVEEILESGGGFNVDPLVLTSWTPPFNS